MVVEFYDVKTRKKVKIDENSIMKTSFRTKNGQIRYGLRAKTSDGRMLTKFVSKADWNSMKYPMEKKDRSGSGLPGNPTTPPPPPKK